MASIIILALILALAATVAGSLFLWRENRLSRQPAEEFIRKAQELEQYQLDLKSEFNRLQRVEKDLRESQAFSESLFQATQAGQIIIDPNNHQIMDVNLAGAKILGCTPNEVIGNDAQIFNLCPRPREGCELDLNAEQGNVQVEFTRLDGTRVPVLRSFTPMWSQASDLVVSSFLDISEMKNKEKELVDFNDKLAQMMEELKKSKEHVAQSEKLASIGQLAAGVAHEINNPLGFVTSNLGTIQEYSQTVKTLLLLYGKLNDLDDDCTEERDALRKEIDRIREEDDLEFIAQDVDSVLNESMDGVNRVAEIVQNLKSFARSDTSTIVNHDINEGIESMIKMVWNELKYHCKVEKNFSEIPEVQCHPGQINQVLMNMLVNASHAIGEKGGTITVCTDVVENQVEIKISDSGKGIPADILPRIFDPFFTTKDVGKGTGLGLSISHGIIHDHGGRIEVDSIVNQGTEFRIYLPLSGGPIPDSSSPSQENPESELVG
ncbi:MAG: PAS domain-containing protein [Gemmatimonadales bacterium]|nr:PAS domain-containing protein [Gemmatimonadales bacterium]